MCSHPEFLKVFRLALFTAAALVLLGGPLQANTTLTLTSDPNQPYRINNTTARLSPIDEPVITSSPTTARADVT